MYLLTPILLILVSLCGIVVIVWRKRVYIKKLVAVDASVQNGSVSLSNNDFFSRLLSEMFPELTSFFKNIKLREYKESWLIEAEKFLRRLRLLSLRLDRLSNTLIHKVRRGYLSSSKPVIVQESKAPEVVTAPTIKTDNEDSGEMLKKEEQRLIIEIAKSPKSSQLYAQLGDLYVKMGDLDDAKESLEAAIELDPHNEDFKKKHSVVLEKLSSSTPQN